MLTIRIELAAALLVSGGAERSRFTHDLQRCDDGILALAKHARSAYRSALKVIERNWRSQDPELLGVRHLFDHGRAR